MFILSTSLLNLQLPADCYDRLINSNVIKSMLASVGVDLSSATTASGVSVSSTSITNDADNIIIPLPDRYQWAIANSYYNWLQSRGCRINKAYKLVQCLQLANFLEDDSYFDGLVKLLLDRWFYRDLSTKVMSQLSVDIARCIYLYLPLPTTFQ